MTLSADAIERIDSEGEILRELRAKLSGDVVTASHPAYGEAKKVWNAMYDDRDPVAVIRCANDSDVQTAVKVLGDVDAQLAVRGGGHHIAGFGSCDGGFVIDLSQMRMASVVTGTDRVRVGGGATLHEVDAETSKVSRAVPLGVVSQTGVGGLTLSGGIGWLTRRCGYTCDSLVAAGAVTSDGQRVKANSDENHELLWALRGGGGNFGIVTEFEFVTHPIDVVEVVEAHHSARSAKEIEELLDFYWGWSADASEDCTAWITISGAGSEQQGAFSGAGEDLVVSLVGCTVDRSEENVDHLGRLESFGSPMQARLGPMRLVDLQQAGDADESAVRGRHQYEKGEMMVDLSSAAISGIAEYCMERRTRHGLFEMGMVGGAMSNWDEMDAAVGMREAKYLAGFSMVAAHDEDHEAGMKWVRNASRVLEPCSAGGGYLNFDGDASAERIMGSLSAGTDVAKRKRLIDLKRRFDPGNRFRMNHNIDPSSAVQEGLG